MHTARHHYHGNGIRHQQWQLEYQEIQDGQEGRIASAESPIFHRSYWHDD